MSRIKVYKTDYWRVPFWAIIMVLRDRVDLNETAVRLSYDDLVDLFNGEVTEIQHETHMGTLYIKSDPKHIFPFDAKDTTP